MTRHSLGSLAVPVFLFLFSIQHAQSSTIQSRFSVCESSLRNVSTSAGYFVDQLYFTLLDRRADTPGSCGYYLDVKYLGKSGMERVAKSILGSLEFSRLRPNLSQNGEGLLSNLYRDILGRSQTHPETGRFFDPSGGETYLPLIRGEVEGRSAIDVIRALVASPEFANRHSDELSSLPTAIDQSFRQCEDSVMDGGSLEAAHYVEQAYQTILGRGADVPGSCGYYLAVRYERQEGLDRMLTSLIGSLEFQNQFDESAESASDFLDRLYKHWLDREVHPDTQKHYDPSAADTYLPWLKGELDEKGVADVVFSVKGSLEASRANFDLSDDKEEYEIPELDEIRPEFPKYPTQRFTFNVAQDSLEREGGLFVHDLNGDGLFDFVITTGNLVSAYDHYGDLLWSDRNAKPYLYQQGRGGGDYPGLHHPGAIAGDMDGDGTEEVAYITNNQKLRILNGRTGAVERQHSVGDALAVVIVNLRGRGDREAVLQYSSSNLRAIDLVSGNTLWNTDRFISIEHSPVKQADLDFDGLDELVGVNMIDNDGSVIPAWNLDQVRTRNVDSIAIGYQAGDRSLKVAIAEQSASPDVSTVVGDLDGITYFGVNRNDRCVQITGNPLEPDCDKVSMGDYDINRSRTRGLLSIRLWKGPLGL